MENQEPVIESEPLPQVELEVDPFESIVDNVIDSTVPVEEDTVFKKDESDSENRTQTTESEIKLKTEPNQGPEVEEEKPKKKRGRPKKTKQYKDDSSSDDELPLKRPFSDLASIKSENGQEETSRRSHRSKRPSSFITKYDTGSGSDDDKLAYKGTQLSDDEYTPDKEANKKGRRRKHDSESSSLNGNAVKRLFGNDGGDTSQDGVGLENIKIESVSSIKKTTQFKTQQADAACLFLTQIMKSASNLGTFVQSKADEFITSRITPDFITDTNKLQFCMEKSFKLLELIKSNLKAIDNDLKVNYVDFIKHNKLENAVLLDKDAVKFLSEHKILFNKDGRVAQPEAKGESDSDCEIVGEIPSTPKKDLDILKKVERNGISWKKHKGSVSSQCSDGSTKIQIPGHSAIFLNRNIQVKKVAQKPQLESFFREDGRTLKPPDPTCQDQYKIKELEKTTFILGWLDIAYRKVSKQFFHIVRELERKKHYESCSDLGESCSDEYSDEESVEDNAKDKTCTNAENIQLKTLVEMCIDKINDTICVPHGLSSKFCDKPINARSLLKYYPNENQVERDDSCVKYSPKSLIEISINYINEIYYKDIKSAQIKKRMFDEDLNCKKSPDKLLILCIKQINKINYCKSSRTSKCESFENCDVSSLFQDENDNEQMAQASRMESSASESPEVIKDLLIENLAPDEIPKHINDLERNQLLSNIKNEPVLDVENNRLLFNIKNEPDLDVADQSVSDNQMMDDDSNVCTDNGDDPMLQVSREVYLNCEYPRKGKKALRDLLQTSSSDGEDLVKGRKKKRVLKKVKRPRKKDKKLPERGHGWSFHNHLKGDPKLYQVCKVSVEKLPSSLVESQQEDQNTNEIAPEDFEIDRLLDFSTLAPRPKTLAETTIKESGAEKQTKNKMIVKEKSANPSLVDFLPTVAAEDSEHESSSLDEESERDIPHVNDLFNNVNCTNLQLNETGGQLLESLENENYKEKSNLFAKKFLILSSSNDSSESDDLSNEKNETVKNKKVADIKIKKVSDTKNKQESDTKNKHVSNTEKSNAVTKSSPVKKIENQIHLNHSRETYSATDQIASSITSIDMNNIQDQVKNILREVINKKKHANGDEIQHSIHSTKPVNNMIISDSPKITSEKDKNKKSEKRKRKNKVVNESDEERRKFQRKKNRLVRNEEKRKQEREIDESSDGDSILTHSSVDSEPLVGNYTKKAVTPNSNKVSPNIKIEPNMNVTRKKSKHHKSILYNQLNKKSNRNDDFPYDNYIDGEEDVSKRRKLREMIDQDQLLATTKLAAKEEEERLLRLSQKKIRMSEIIPNMSPLKKSPLNKKVSQSFILDADIATKESLLSVHPTLTTIMKEHQMDGVKFMWDTCFESVEMVKSGHRGGGCILAHCMGLGKSLQVITLIHTILSSDLPLRTVLVCCPLSTVLNWVDEFKKWLRKIDSEKSIKIYELSKYKKHYERSFHLEDWHKTGGVFIMGYEMFRLLTNLREAPDCKAHVIHKIRGTLLNPGPDLVVCDEGHLLKNDNTILAKLMNRIHTRRRIILTGTPLQNNLREYYCMVNFVKPNLLGSRKEYTNRFENPILNGQHRNSSVHDINIMKKRSHVLHKMLEGCVQRKEATLLYKYLPRKREYVLLVTLSECQTKIYSHYLSKYANSSCARGAPLLKDFHLLQKIWTHPRTLHNFFQKLRDNKLRTPRIKEKVEFSVNSEGVICLEDIGDVAEESLATPDDSDWLGDFITEKELEEIECSPKFSITFQLLEECILSGDKMLIFSMSLFTLDALEYFLRKRKKWLLGKNYYRLDGSVTLENRQKWCRNFNSEKNKDVKLFLISTRAGGLGINMIAANRVIIMDVSWNPSLDIQSIFRVFRFGQKKDCYIYRLVAMGTMEETIYERSVTKQAISLRVVDEQQIDRHYSTDELSELYSFNPIPASPRVLPNIPSDEVLAAVLASSITNSSDKQTSRMPLVWSIHEHDSLLRDLHDEQLPEEERVAAWLEYQAEKEAQKMQKERERSRLVANSNCIIPDNHLPSKNPKRPRLNANNRLNMPDHMDGNDLLQPVSFRNVISGMVRSNYQKIPSPAVMPFTLGSYSAIIQQMMHAKNQLASMQANNQLTSVQVNNQLTSMQERTPQIEASSYQIPFSYNDMFELECTDGFNNQTIMEPPSQRDSQNESTQFQTFEILPQRTNVASNWDGPSTSANSPNQLNEPAKKKPSSKSRKKRRTPKKKTPPRVPERISISDDDHVVYLPPVCNGFNSSDAESIVPDRNDSPIITIESD